MILLLALSVVLHSAAATGTSRSCAPGIHRISDTLPPFQKDLSVVRSIEPADTDFSDLSGLAAAIGSSRIVLLGEQTHGEASTFLAKTRIIHFLHEKMGFNVLAFESGFYDCARIWDNTQHGGTFSKEVIGSLFYMYATSHQMQPLFDYIQGRLHRPDSLIVTGFESQHTGADAKKDLFPDWETYFRQQDPGMLDADWELFRRVSLATFASPAYRPTEEEKKIFFRKLAEVKATLSKPARARSASANSGPAGLMGGGHFSNSGGFWYQVARSIESQAVRYWGIVKDNANTRDRQMAENLIWLAEKAFPDQKIIVWAHNGHIAKNTDQLQSASGGVDAGFLSSFVPMGAAIHAHFGDRAFHIGFSAAEGTYMDFNDSKIITLPPLDRGSIEGWLSAAGYKYAFVDYRHAKGWLRRRRDATLDDYIRMTGTWPESLDGMFFIRNVFPVDR